jgi:lipopolysaccharide transport system permease protein
LKISLSRLWAYRGFIFATVGRDFSLRYRNSILGAVWVVVNPLAMILVYTLIFSRVMQARLPGVESPFAYSIFLMSGLLPWGLFSDLVARGPYLFLEQANLLKKMQLPKLSFLIVLLCNAIINFLIIETLFVVFLMWVGQFPGWPFLALIPLLILQLWFSAALLLILALLNVFFRDIVPITNIALQFGFWLTPIVYAASMIPPRFQVFLHLNPLANLFEAYHTIFVGHDWPDWSSLWSVALFTLLLTGLAYHLFQVRSSEMIDQL